MALAHTTDAAGQAATAGSSATPTTTAAYPIGALALVAVVLKGKTWSSITINDQQGGANTWQQLGRADHPSANLSCALLASVLNQAIPSSTNISVNWGVSITGRYASTYALTGETFNLANALAAITTSVTGGTSLSFGSASPLTDAGVGLAVVGLDQNVAITQGAGWTERRDAGNTAPMRHQTTWIERGDANPYAPSASWSGSANGVGLFVHIDNGTPVGGGDDFVPRLALLGAG